MGKQADVLMGKAADRPLLIRRRNSEKDSTSVNREVRKQSRRGGCL